MYQHTAESLPIWLQYIGLGLSVCSAIGVVLAAPTLLQIFLGGPKLNTRFDDAGDGNGALLVFLENKPAANWLGRLALVKRDTIESLTVSLQIGDVGTGSLVVPIRQARIYSDDDPTDLGRDRITLPPTYSVGASIVVTRWNPAINLPEVPATRIQEAVPLKPGTYEARIALLVDGLPEIQVKQFTVGATSADLSWQEDTTDEPDTG